MPTPIFLSPDDENINTVARIFDAPLVTKGWTWLPLTQLVAWGLMTREAGRLHPERSRSARLGVGALTMLTLLGSEWCHNLAHAAAARWVGHPTDAILVNFGMPLLVYHDTEDPNVTPRQHMIRALGGPALNLIFWTSASVLRWLTRPKTAARDVVNTAIYMNAFLVLGGLSPIPFLDGGAALKWLLVEKGQTLRQADETVKKVNLASSAAFGASSAVAYRRRKRFLGGLLAAFAALALLVGLGLFKEKPAQ